MQPAGLQPKVIAFYSSESIDMEFKKIESKIFVDTLTKGGSRNEYPLDPSFSRIKAVPLDLRSSSKKTIRWLLNNQYFPCIQDGRIVFHFKNPEFSNADVTKIVIESAPPPHISHVKHQEEFSQLFSDNQIRVQLDNPDSQDIEGQYSKCLIQAKKQNFVEEQIFYLKKLGDIYIQKQNFPTCAKLLNCAIAVVPHLKDDSLQFSINKCLFSQLDLIECLFLKNQGFEVPLKKEKSLSYYRNSLRSIRESARLAQTNQEPIQEVLSSLTQAFKNILVELIFETMNLMGPPSVQWACIGMGSMSRGEMCPYSDVEFAFLIENDTPQAMRYFRALSKILELKIINLGETKFPIFGGGCESPTPDGFCMDSGGNTPIGVPGIYELIGTPKQLAQFQNLKWIDGNIILSNVMSNVCFVTGNQSLIVDYMKEKEIIQQTKAKPGQIQQMNGEILAMRLLVGHIREFYPDLSKDKEERSAFNVKRELYRPFQEILSSLAILYHLKTQSTFDRIDELKQMKILCPEGAENLKKALGKVFSFRLQVQFFYKDEREDLCHCEEGRPQSTSLFYMNEEQIEFLHTVYQVLLPFHKCVSNFYQTRNVESLNNDNFLDDSPLVRGQTFQKTLQYAKAQDAYQQAVSLNPNDIEAQLWLGIIEKTMGKSKDALLRNLKALALAQQKYGENDPYVAISYTKIGKVYNDLGEYDKALEFFQNALKIWLHVVVGNHSFLATIYQDTSSVYNNLGKWDEALNFSQKALNIYLQIKGENHLNVASSYNDIGTIYSNLRKDDKAIEFFQKALKICLLHALGESHPGVASIYNHIGCVYNDLGKYNNALEYHEKALNIHLQIFEENHPDVASSYNYIGRVYYSRGEYNKALEFHEKALKVHLRFPLGENHLNVASSYNDIGCVYQSLRKYDKALEFHQKALKINLQLLEENNPNVASNYNNIGEAYGGLGNYNQMLDYFEKGLKIRLLIFGEYHPDVASSYSNIGVAYDRKEVYDKAIEFYHKALHIWLSEIPSGKNHPDMASCYYNIGIVHGSRGEYEQALDCFEKALKVRVQIFDKNSPKLAEIYLPIGISLEALGKPQEALKFYKQGLHIFLLFGGPTDPNVQKIQTKINYILNVRKNQPMDTNPKESQQVGGCITCLFCCIFYGCCCCCCGSSTEESEKLIQ